MLEFTCSPHFQTWLHEQQLSFAFTTYPTNRLFFLGLKPDGQLSIFERLFDRPMGLYATPDRLYLSSRFQIWQFENALPVGAEHNGYDKLYVPRLAYTTGDLTVRELATDSSGRIIFTNTLYSCLAATSDRYNFTPVWRPPFINQLAPEERCRLNGLAVADGQPRYVTVLSPSNGIREWRERPPTEGCLLDVLNDEILVANLSRPHSPRWYGGKLWLLNSGTGDLGWVDEERGVFEAIAFCPGYLRGLAFYKNWAAVGLSKARHNGAFSGLTLGERLAEEEAQGVCGIAIVNLNTGAIDHWFQVEGLITELYDLQILTGVRRPMALGFKTDEICRLMVIDPQPLDLFQRQEEQVFIREAKQQGQIFPELDNGAS
ncbi:MAG: TIGR03032 family protein [Cyanobacteriota bacterium]|nr:TIGR03032 family protein [Cyanobacteriota bacterium]